METMAFHTKDLSLNAGVSSPLTCRCQNTWESTVLIREGLHSHMHIKHCLQT